MSALLALPEIRFGLGSISQTGEILDRLGILRPLIVTDAGVRASGGVDRFLAANPNHHFAVFDGVTEPPTFAGVDAAAAVYRSNGCDGVIAIGGGSVIDTAKMAAVLATHPGNAADYSGKSEAIVRPIAPIVTVPTTSGSGSEVSPSTGMHPAAGVVALRTRSPELLAKAAICDPELTVSMPPRLTAATGLDALTHCIEGYLSPVSNPLIDALAIDGIRRISRSIERAISNGSDREARAEMMMGALQGGIAIAKGLGPAHAMATAFSHWPVPHGVLAAVSLPSSLDLIQPRATERMGDVSRAMGLEPGVRAADGFRALLVRVNKLTGLPVTLAGAKQSDTDIRAIAVASHASPVNRTSPYYPTVEEFHSMVTEVLA